jgi:hypothetical protein
MMMVAPRAARPHHRLIGLVLFLLLLTITLGTLGRAGGDGPLHGPDAHSAIPHHEAPLSLRAEARLLVALVLLLGGDLLGWLAAEATFHPGRLATEPLDQPPRYHRWGGHCRLLGVVSGHGTLDLPVLRGR